VLIEAEPGLDPEAVARAIHQGGRSGERFLRLDCAGTDAVDLEAALFGTRGNRRHRGSALEVVSDKGLVVRAGEGTLFLANIPELPASTQGRLARLLRDGEMTVRETRHVASLGARVTAAAGPALPQDVEEGRFRDDLYRRVGTLRVEIPPLRRRPDDLAAITAVLIETICRNAGLPLKKPTPMALTLLKACPWRGNTRELRTFLERVVLDAASETIQLEDLLAHVRLDGRPAPAAPTRELREARRQFEREYIAAVIRHHHGRMVDAARALGLQRTNLYRKIRQLGIAGGGARTR